MNIHAANELSITEIQEKIRLSPNPLEDKPLIELVCEYLKTHKQDHTPFDARRWISIMGSSQEKEASTDNQVQLIKKNSSIRNPALLVYLNDLNFPINIARQYLVELKIYSARHKKHFFALGFPNENEGFFITNPLMEGWIGEPYLSFIKGKNPKTDTLHIFHSCLDYLSLLSHLKVEKMETDAIILNSLEDRTQILGYIYQSAYKKVYSWLPNNPTGRRAIRHISSLLGSEKSLIHIKMNAFYQPFDNVNDWYSQASH
ncbi:hypothetical protein [Emticicia fluvialis]|uniref:hypothetical protein n=1 Tax=Emticicia fluvialis TaxID=2974474 RepID=UPI002165D656|nr:hypothetical protein [Emticicia fluvialis]